MRKGKDFSDSLNANQSFKYFGKEQGVSVYTFRDERDLLMALSGVQRRGSRERLPGNVRPSG